MKSKTMQIDYRGKRNNPVHRTPRQIDEDFEETVSLLEEGHTWDEVTFIINDLRDYSITEGALKSIYSSRIQKAALKRSPEEEKERAIRELETIMLMALTQYNESMGEKQTIQEQGWVDELGVIKSPFKIVKTMQSTGDTQYLNVYMKALDKKIKLLNLEGPKEFNINHFLKNAIIDDESENKLPPITSEQEAREFGEDL